MCISQFKEIIKNIAIIVMEIMMRSSTIEVIDKKQDSIIKQEEEEEEEGQYFHVLAVDDSLIDRKLLERLLKVSSYKVTCVDSGDEALRYLGLVGDDVDKYSSSSSPHSPPPPQEGSKVNLIMTDYCMPGMSGYDLLKRVKGSSWKDVPVVIMSSENVPSRISKCLEGGAEEFLLKPVQLSDLKKIENYLLKPLIGHACEIINDNDDNDNDDDDDDKISNLIETSNCNNNKISNIISKRKAVMSPSPSVRRPNKVKGLAVV